MDTTPRCTGTKQRSGPASLAKRTYCVAKKYLLEIARRYCKLKHMVNCDREVDLCKDDTR